MAAYVGPEASITTFKYDAASCGGTAPDAVIDLNILIPFGDLTFRNVTIDATGASYGMRVVNSARVNLRDAIVENAATAGIDYTNAFTATRAYSLELQSSEVVDNGIGVSINGFGTIEDSTIYGNTVGLRLANYGVSLLADTISGNQIGVDAPADPINLPELSVQLTTVAGNAAHDCDSAVGWEIGEFGSQNNLVGADCGNRLGVDTTYDPGRPIGAPADNGGPTPSILPPPQAVGAGGAAGPCTSTGLDQREAVITGSVCDIGSVQSTATAAPSPGPLCCEPNSLGLVQLGQTVQSGAVLTNHGGGIVGVTGVDLSGDGFTLGNNGCVDVLLTHDVRSCTVAYSFTPTVARDYSAVITVHTTAGDVTFTVTATGVFEGRLAFDPIEADFPDTPDWLTVGPGTVVVENVGETTFTLSSVALVGAAASEYVFKTHCPPTLAVGAFCTVSLSFSPTLAGDQSASLEFTDSVTGSVEDLPLDGNGIGATVSLSTDALELPATLVGAESQLLPVTIENTSSIGLQIGRVEVTSITDDVSAFPVTNGCTARIAPGRTCTLMVKFVPSHDGEASAFIAIHDNAEDSPQGFSVEGLGRVGSLSMAGSLSFDGTPLKGTTVRTLVAASVGSGAATISDVQIEGPDAADFMVVGRPCRSPLNPGAVCDVGVAFKPRKAGTATADIVITDNTPDHTHAVALSGTGIGTPAGAASPGTVVFGPTGVGRKSAPVTVTLRNASSTTPLSVVRAALVNGGASEFAIVQDNCTGRDLAVGGACTLVIASKPTRRGVATAYLELWETGVSPQLVALRGTGK